MSGFAGIVRLEPTQESVEADRQAIARMAEAIAFRGPDAKHHFAQNGATFVFSLLTTGPAPQAPSQPVTLDGETFFLGEARLDGRQELIEKLTQHSDEISPSRCDEELVLRFVKRFGVDALPELDGDFSFVLWNSRERKLLGFRDLTGARPFFYSHKNGQLAFSNSLQALLAAGTFKLHNYDPEFIANFLLGEPHYNPERTIYAEVRRLAVGHRLEFSNAGVSTRPIAAYPIEEPLLRVPDSEVLEEFRRLFAQAVRDRLPESETAILLSGGLDSTSVTAAAVALRKKQNARGKLRLSAFTLDFYPLFQDEDGPLAQGFAASLALPCQMIHQAHILPLEGADKGPATLPEPYDCPYPGLQPFYVSQFRTDSRVLLTGDGGDETLRAQAGPFVRHVASRSGMAHASSLVLRYVLSRRRWPALGAGLRTGFLRLVGKRPAPPPALPPWIEPAFERQFAARKRFSEISRWPSSAHPYHPWSYGKLVRFIPPLMEGQDAMFSGRPVEARAPFLDRRLIRFLFRLPPIPWYMEKELLRRAQRGILPDTIRLQPKMPLQYDPLQLHIAAGKWSPGLPDSCQDVLQDTIDWPRVRQLLTTATGYELYIHLRPVLLALWLNAVEKHGVIQ
jgi:asparagine synthase (glutamine-hydrolysing)